MGEVTELQGVIDGLDDDIIKLLERRFQSSRRIGHLKRQEGVPLLDPARMDKQRERFVDLCKLSGLDSGMSERLIAVIIDQVVNERLEMPQK